MLPQNHPDYLPRAPKALDFIRNQLQSKGYDLDGVSNEVLKQYIHKQRNQKVPGKMHGGANKTQENPASLRQKQYFQGNIQEQRACIRCSESVFGERFHHRQYFDNIYSENEEEEEDYDYGDQEYTGLIELSRNNATRDSNLFWYNVLFGGSSCQNKKNSIYNTHKSKQHSHSKEFFPEFLSEIHSHKTGSSFTELKDPKRAKSRSSSYFWNSFFCPPHR